MVIEVNDNYAGILFQTSDIINMANAKGIRLTTVSDVIGMLEKNIYSYINLIENNTSYKIVGVNGTLNIECLSLSGGAFCTFISNNETSSLDPAESYSFTNGVFSKVGEDGMKEDEREQLVMLSFAKALFLEAQRRISEGEIEDEENYEEDYEEEDIEEDDGFLSEDEVKEVLEGIAAMLTNAIEEGIHGSEGGNIVNNNNKLLVNNTVKNGKADFIKSVTDKKNEKIDAHLAVAGSLDELINYTVRYKKSLLPYIKTSHLVKGRTNYYKLIMNLDVTRDDINKIKLVVNQSIEFIDLIIRRKDENGELIIEKDAYQGLLQMGE